MDFAGHLGTGHCRRQHPDAAYPQWVKKRNSRRLCMMSALPPFADVSGGKFNLHTATNTAQWFYSSVSSTSLQKREFSLL